MMEPLAMDTTDETVERAIALASEGTPGEAEALQLAAVGRDNLERARAELVRRIYQRSDDYEATAALSLVNKALAAVGWEDPYNWKHRRKP
jgi:hypothetical protein